MNIWHCKKWKNIYKDYEIRKGIRVRVDKEVDPEVRRACIEFCKWLRTQYCFPIRVPIYIKRTDRIKAMNGEMVFGTFFGPDNFLDEPYIKVAVGDYKILSEKNGKDNALAAYLGVIVCSLTHYFYWVNQIRFDDATEEKNAEFYRDVIIEKYSETREHP